MKCNTFAQTARLLTAATTALFAGLFVLTQMPGQISVHAAAEKTAGMIVSQMAVQKQTALANGVVYTHQSGVTAAGSQNIHTVIAQKNSGATLVVGGHVQGRALVDQMAASMIGQGQFQKVLAGVNGDHFSFQTGVPLGFSVSQGRILTSTVEPYEADEYFFHTLAMTKDGKVLTGVNPTLKATYTVGGVVRSIERINRTRETWEGGQLCLFTPDWGSSTKTNVGGIELAIRVDEGAAAPGGSLKGKVIGIYDEGDAPLEAGTVVLSGCINRYDELAKIKVGASISMQFTFSDSRWNQVVFAVGGNATLVSNGKPLHFDYKLSVFSAPQPRTALGIRADGSILLVAIDGRSGKSAGMTANEMADYMANQLGCTNAILLDGGGSTAMACAPGGASPAIWNTPSEQRPVGNGVFLVIPKAATSAAAKTTTGKSTIKNVPSSSKTENSTANQNNSSRTSNQMQPFPTDPESALESQNASAQNSAEGGAQTNQTAKITPPAKTAARGGLPIGWAIVIGLGAGLLLAAGGIWCLFRFYLHR